MSWEYWVFLLAAVAVLAAVFYFAARGDKPKAESRAGGKEPSFGGSSSNPASAAPPVPGATPPAPVNAPQPAARPREPQGTLAMEPFTPPELPQPPESLLSLEMCYAAWLYGRQAIEAAVPEALQKQLRGDGNQNYYLLGFDAVAEQWRLLPDMRCEHWIIAMPLADRGGAISEDDLRRFEEQVRTFCQKAALHPVFSSASEALDNSRRIDDFCAAVDMFIELRLTGGRQPAERIDEVMRLVGMTAEGERGYICRAESEALFRGKVVPAPASGNRQTIILEMDAPNVSNPPRAFGEMLRSARRAAQMLSMQITDPLGEPIDEPRAAEMSKQLFLLTTQMREFGAEPGGAVARLIFS